MSMQDPIADMLTRIRNAQSVGERTVVIPASKLKVAIIKVLESEGYVLGHEVNTVDGKKVINVALKYYDGRPVIEKIKRISSPGLRVYKGSRKMPVVRAGMGIAIVTTSKGVMSEKSARDQNLGGEVLCTVE